MNRKSLLAFVGILAVGVVLTAAFSGKLVFGDPPKDAKAGALPPDFKLPAGWTMEDLQACMAAGMPGKNQELLAKQVGVWQGKSTMRMAPDAETVTTNCTITISPMMDGRFTKTEMTSDSVGMGPFSGFGIAGYDNVSGQFVTTWIDNQSTGIMNGTGSLSPDGKVLTWKFTFNCPITKKPAAMREVDTTTGPNTKTLEMYGDDPKTGKEFKMISIELTRKP